MMDFIMVPLIVNPPYRIPPERERKGKFFLINKQQLKRVFFNL